MRNEAFSLNAGIVNERKNVPAQMRAQLVGEVDCWNIFRVVSRKSQYVGESMYAPAFSQRNNEIIVEIIMRLLSRTYFQMSWWGGAPAM